MEEMIKYILAEIWKMLCSYMFHYWKLFSKNMFKSVNESIWRHMYRSVVVEFDYKFHQTKFDFLRDSCNQL